MADLKELVKQRGRVKAQLTRIETSITSNPQMTASSATVRLKRVEELWHEFSKIQNQIDDCAPDNEEEKQAFVLDQEKQKTDFEEAYFENASALQSVIDAKQTQQNHEVSMSQNANQTIGANSTERIIIQERRNKPKFPTITLETFDGKFTKWLPFKNSFQNSIIKDTDLTGFDKIRYLRGQLQGPAKEIIECFEDSDENFATAWKMLTDTYDNEVIIIETHIEELLNFPEEKKEDKAETIQDLVRHLQRHTAALKLLHQPVESWDTIIIHQARKHLDFIEQRDWQNLIKDRTPEDMPTLKEFTTFLTQRCQALRLLQQGKPKKTKEKEKSAQKPLPSQKKVERKDDKNVSLPLTSITCRVCGKEHFTYKCPDLETLSVENKRKLLIEKRLCLNCLKPGHQAKGCGSSGCQRCQQKHNTILHPENLQANGSGETASVSTHCADTRVPASVCFVKNPTTQIILSTALVDVYDARGNTVTCRALLDPGSQVNFMTVDLARKLKLPVKSESRLVSGINQVKTDTSRVVMATIKARENDFSAQVECNLMPSITEKLPQSRIEMQSIILPKEVKLADPGFNEPGKIAILIGAGLYWKSIVGRPRNRIEGQPALQNTKFGWIVGGELTPTGQPAAATSLMVTNAQLSDQLERFWKQEALTEKPCLTREEKACEKYFQETVRRDAEGRFIVRLPLRENIVLGDSRGNALRRLFSLERRLNRDPELRKAYHDFMDEYSDLNHMTQVQDENSLRGSEVYYIPHLAVVRPDSLTTRVRCVFDASSKTTSGFSLNDKLMPGPNLQNNLLVIILKLRLHKFVITADIQKMFRQIWVAESDRNYQLILWRKDPKEPVKTFRLNTVTYGQACAVYHAIRCLRELARLYRKKYPRAAKAIEEDAFMDDFLTGAKTLVEVIQLLMELLQLLMEAKFPLKKWRSNDPRVLQHLAEQSETDPLLVLDKEEAMKTLGLQWNSAQDNLQYQVKLSQGPVNTKRLVLSRISQIFDPLGLIGPILMQGKIFMQQLWSDKIGWDDQLPPELQDNWDTYYQSLAHINELLIPRNVNPGNPSEKVEIFGFGDASQRAYGACLYVVSKNSEGVKQARLLCSKSRVAPLKTISLPRLELEAAFLLAQLYDVAKTTFKDRIEAVKLWSDSTIVLGWINAEPQKLKTFVANRVVKIHELTEEATWSHVPSEDNPADILSRSATFDQVEHNDLWWYGPLWLVSEDQRPQHMEPPETELPEVKSNSVALVATTIPEKLREFPLYSKLCRVIALCQRFIRNLKSRKAKKSRETGPVTVDEREAAEKAVIKLVQQETFAPELRCLREDRVLPAKSLLVGLKPFIDGDGIIRVGGRLEHAQLPMENKHPIVLPPKQHVTHLIMRREHVRLLHCPPEQLLHSVREKFWPLSGRREARKVIRRCVKCFCFRPKSPRVEMGDLPPERVQAYSRPFTVSGVDYAGPIQVRESRRRGRIHVSKGYVAVFVCLSTKAVHLELVSELTTDAFLAALQRFTARRGLCSHLFSDNGLNFVGASRELKEVFEFLKKEESTIIETLAEKKITWHFIPPRAPHFGGLWEAAVKAMKRHLYTITQGKVYTFEEYSTLLCDIEAVLNSRPLTPLTNDPSDFTVLTPSHFLTGGSLVQPVQTNLLDVSDHRIPRWKQFNKLRHYFWSLCQKGYLQELQKR